MDRSVPTPLWAQVLADLRLRLARGEFESRFPGDVELTDQYGVSRHTVREAVRHLQVEGVIDRGRGRGTFLRRPVIEQSLGTFYSLFRSVEAQGFVQRSVVRCLEERTDRQAAAVLDCEPDEPLVYLERLRLADEQPIVLDCSWMPARVARPLLGVDFTHTALYRELQDRCGVLLSSGWERMLPVLPTAEQRHLLCLGPRAPALSIERFARSGPSPVEWRHGVVRTDRVSFVARWAGYEVEASFEPAGREQGR
ncbi:MAG: GntR family transcriptional regulator [Acidimicrobiales bacterium]